MIAAREYFPRLTPDEYLEWEATQEFRHEYINGEVYAMAGGTVNHGQIAANFTILLGIHLENSSCRILNSDVRVNIQAANSYVYPDVSVTCDERDRLTAKYISHPRIVVEVLSPTTEAYDRGKKFDLYCRSSSLQEYVLVSTQAMSVDIYRRNFLDRWEIINYRIGDLVELKSIDMTVAIERIFRGIVFESPTETENR
jgi:Uma2 family endonuclease